MVKALTLGQAVAARNERPFQEAKGGNAPIVAYKALASLNLDGDATRPVLEVSAAAFYSWYKGMVERIYGGPSRSVPQDLLMLLAEMDKPALDSFDRWYMIECLTKTKRFRESGIRLFAHEEDQGAS